MTESLKSFKLKFGRQLYEAKMAKGLTNRQLATALDVVPSAISCWENGHHLPKPENRRRICEMFPALSTFFKGEVLKPKKEEPDTAHKEPVDSPPMPVCSTRPVWHTSEGFCWMVESAANAWQSWLNLKKELTHENEIPSHSSVKLAQQSITRFLQEEESKVSAAPRVTQDSAVKEITVPMYRTADGTEWKRLAHASLWASWLKLHHAITTEGTRKDRVEEVHSNISNLTYEAERREYKAPGEGVTWKRV